jgi:tetratricopeptide (TPR) repeat protein
LADVDAGMKAVEQLYEAGGRYKALERLQETFFLGEYCPQIMFFDPAKKTVMAGIWQDMQNLQRVGDERDLAVAEVLVKKLKEAAEDFPAAQVTSRVNNAKRASNLALFAAKQSAVSGDAAKVEQQLERAAKIWPQNPAIEDFTRIVENRADAASQKVPEFDALLKEGKLRDIFKQKEVFALALLQDKGRTEQLTAALEKVGRVDAAIVQARILKDQGNGYTAWDALQLASGISPDDPELGRARRDLAPLIADYTRAVVNAEKEDRAAHNAASLAWYLAAQDLNTGSELCRQAVKRLSVSVLESLGK